MINATTHTGAEHALRNEAGTVRRIGPQAFATLLGLELLLVAGVLIWALSWATPAATPLAASHDLTPIQEAIRARIGGDVDDPLIEVAPGLSARSSNLRGFSLGSTTYYYYVEGAANFDPYSRGSVDASEIEVLLRDSSDLATVVIYRLL
ncbi:MAG: hypothetical protein HGA45_09135 [Chloroflexales bacterium]|nr:hypothetical protein [Chloroflexales bacterium]